MIRPTHRVDGRRLARRDRARPAFVGAVDDPASDLVLSNAATYEVRGWAASTRHRPMTAFARVDDRSVVEIPIGDDRPDVIDALGAAYGITTAACGFHLDLELPESTSEPVSVEIELTDGEFVARSPRFRLRKTKGDRTTKTRLADAHLRGEGVEFGALHQPLEVDTSRCVVHYADRLSREEAFATFPELRAYEGFVDPDILIDLDRSDLSELGDRGFDFFIANDVIEHLANPVRFLQSIHDVMKPGAVLFLSVPDRDYTFDMDRDVTPFEHLWDEYERGVTTVDNAHVREFARQTRLATIPRNPLLRGRVYRRERERSIHVHVWTKASFEEFLAEACDRLHLDFEIIDRGQSEHATVYVLRRTEPSP